MGWALTRFGKGSLPRRRALHSAASAGSGDAVAVSLVIPFSGNRRCGGLSIIQDFLGWISVPTWESAGFCGFSR